MINQCNRALSGEQLGKADSVLQDGTQSTRSSESFGATEILRTFLSHSRLTRVISALMNLSMSLPVPDSLLAPCLK
jgi:hypothetical protein